MGYSYGSVSLTLRGTVEIGTMTPTTIYLRGGDAVVYVEATDRVKEQFRDLVRQWDMEEEHEARWGDGIMIP